MISTDLLMFSIAQIWRWYFANFHWLQYYHSIKLLAVLWALEFNHIKNIQFLFNKYKISTSAIEYILN